MRFGDQQFSLIVKAEPRYAKIEAATRGLILTDATPTSCGETVGIVRTNVTNLQKWCAEDLGREAPYPQGALLYFGSIEPLAFEEPCAI